MIEFGHFISSLLQAMKFRKRQLECIGGKLLDFVDLQAVVSLLHCVAVMYFLLFHRAQIKMFPMHGKSTL